MWPVTMGFALILNGTVCKSCVGSAILYGSEDCFLIESEI